MVYSEEFLKNFLFMSSFAANNNWFAVHIDICSCVNLMTKSSVPIIHYKQNRLGKNEKSFSQKPKLELQLNANCE